jgi:hypothetical protein
LLRCSHPCVYILAAVATLCAMAARSTNAASVQKIYWALDSDVFLRRANLDGSQPEIVPQSPGGLYPAVEWDAVGGVLYLPAPGAGGILASIINSDRFVAVVPDVEPHRIAIDQVNRKLYWGDYSDSIWRSNLDGSSKEQLVGNSPLVRALSVDGAKGYFYWADNIFGVRRAAIAGGEAQVLLNSSDFNRQLIPSSIAFDPEGEVLYVADRALDAILRVGVDGSNPTRLITDGVIAPRGVSFDPIGQRIYWSNSLSSRSTSFEFFNYVMSANLDGSDVRREFRPPYLRGSVPGPTRPCIWRSSRFPFPSPLRGCWQSALRGGWRDHFRAVRGQKA